MDINQAVGRRSDRRPSRFTALTILLAALAASASAAAFPSYINYQGKLGDPSGNPLTGVYSFRFRFYDSPTKSTLLATEAGYTGGNAVNVTNGLYSVQIGSITALPETVFHQTEVWLEITVGQGAGNTGPEVLDPPERLAATPFSFRAIAADKLGTGMTVATFTAAGNLTLPYGVTAATASFTNMSVTDFITSLSSVNASAFFGDGSHLSGISPGEANTYASSKTFTSNVGVTGAGGITAVSGSFGAAPTLSTFTTTGNLQMVSGSTITSNGTISFSTAASAATTSTPNLFIGANGNVGVGTATPGASLEVAGGLRINTTTAKPTCDASQRGTAWLQQGAGGVADLMYFCMKTTADTYQWVQLGIGN